MALNGYPCAREDGVLVRMGSWPEWGHPFGGMPRCGVVRCGVDAGPVVSVVNVVLWAWAVDVEVGVGCWCVDFMWMGYVHVHPIWPLVIGKCLVSKAFR